MLRVLKILEAHRLKNHCSKVTKMRNNLVAATSFFPRTLGFRNAFFKMFIFFPFRPDSQSSVSHISGRKVSEEPCRACLARGGGGGQM